MPFAEQGHVIVPHSRLYVYILWSIYNQQQQSSQRPAAASLMHSKTVFESHIGKKHCDKPRLLLRVDEQKDGSVLRED